MQSCSIALVAVLAAAPAGAGICAILCAAHPLAGALGGHSPATAPVRGHAHTAGHHATPAPANHAAAAHAHHDAAVDAQSVAADASGGGREGGPRLNRSAAIDCCPTARRPRASAIAARQDAGVLLPMAQAAASASTALRERPGGHSVWREADPPGVPASVRTPFVLRI
jgi:hypothetical protein